jgi:hypothetical protein
MSEKFILQGEDASDQEVVSNSSFLCLRSEHVCKKPVGTRSVCSKDPNDKINWILHGQLTGIEKIKRVQQPADPEQSEQQRRTARSRFKVMFNLHSDSSSPSDAMLYDEKPSMCSVEIIPKSETDT